MGEARQVMDRVTETMFRKDLQEARQLYADDATGVTPDQGELKGGDAIVDYLQQFFEAFPDAGYEPLHSHEAGNTAIDEGYFVGTNTGALQLPTGESLPATGKQIRVRSCDVATVENGRITSHRFYFDQMDFLGQLGLVPEASDATELKLQP
jgi:ketosteroid isomerase-like protein